MSSIILVDDEKELCLSIANFLQREFPHNLLRSTTNPVEAKEWIQRERPKILITDVRMPGLSGLDLFSELNQNWGAVPTIMMTAYKSAELEKAIPHNTFHYLQKPFKNKALASLIKSIFEQEEPSTGFAGTITVSTLADVVQLHSLAGSSGVLVVDTKTEQGQIHYSKGRIIHAICNEQQGRQAFNVILSWTTGQFYFIRRHVTHRTIQVPASELLIDALRILDEGTREANNDNAHVPKAEKDALDWLFDEFEFQEHHHQVLPITPIDPNDPNEHSIPSEPPTLSMSGSFHAAPFPPPSDPSLNAALSSFFNPSSPFSESIIRSIFNQIKDLSGFLGACIGELPSTSNPKGRIIGSLDLIGIDWDQLLQAQHNAITQQQAFLKLAAPDGIIEDTILRTEHHVQIFYPSRHENIFFLLLLERLTANPTLARITLRGLDQQLVITASPSSFTGT